MVESASSSGAKDLLRAFRKAVDQKIARDLAHEEQIARELRARVLPAVRTAIAEARTEGLCAEVWLFGSYAWGTPTAHSDVDLLVAGAARPLLVAARVTRACGRDVHAVGWERAPRSLRERVLVEGTRL